MVKYSERFLLSNTASSHASAYLMSNKSVTLDGKTHVVWTDEESMTKGRTYDHASGQWSDTMTIGVGADDHNTPCLTADAGGFLHLAYGPHGVWGDYPDSYPGAVFKYAIAEAPNTLDGLQNLVNGRYPFGYRATYAALLHVPPGVDCIVNRGGEHPPSLMFQRRTALGSWTNARALMAQDIPPQYTYYGAMITCDAAGTLYVAGAFYGGERKYSLGVAALKSTDLGDTWTDLVGNPVDTPIYYDPQFAVPHSAAELDPRINGMAVDSTGTLWALTCNRSILDRALPLSRWTGDGWQTTDLAAFMPEDRVPFESHMTIDSKDRIHVAVTALSTQARGERDHLGYWAHPSLEIFHLLSSGDGGFVCNQLSEPDPDRPNWLPSISAPSPYQPVEKPVILYTCGNKQNASELYCVIVESADGHQTNIT